MHQSRFHEVSDHPIRNDLLKANRRTGLQPRQTHRPVKPIAPSNPWQVNCPVDPSQRRGRSPILRFNTTIPSHPTIPFHPKYTPCCSLDANVQMIESGSIARALADLRAPVRKTCTRHLRRDRVQSLRNHPRCASCSNRTSMPPACRLHRANWSPKE
jgi:hypothetical protein